MLGDNYIDPSQPWLGTQATSSSVPWWQGAVDFVSKVTSTVKKAQPAITSIQQQISQLKQNASSPGGYATSYNNYAQDGSPLPPPQANSNTGLIVLGVGAAIAVGALIYVVVSGNKKEEKQSKK